MNFIPFKIKKEFDGLLTAEWDDGFKSVIKLEKLRNECPCADCREKNEQSSKAGKFMMPTFSHGKNELKTLAPVGNYAINAVWGDGHDTGIYPWEFFRIIFENYKLSESDLKEFLDAQKNKSKIPDLKLRSN